MKEQRADLTWSEIFLFAAGSLAGAVLGLWAVGRMAAAMADAAPGFWFVSRSAGIVSYVLLWVATVWGVSLSAKGVGGIMSAPLAYALHNVTSWLALGFSTVHALALLGDRVVPFTLRGVAIPFAADYSTVLTGIGTLALYIGVLVSVTFYWKNRIGYRAWRTIHALSYAVFVMVTVHAVMLGTDSSNVLMQAVYIIAGGSVLFLTLFRIFTARGARKVGPVMGAGTPAPVAVPAEPEGRRQA